MKELAKEAWLYWKLAIFKCAGKAVMALIMSIVASLNGTEWSNFTPTQQFVAGAAALGSLWTVIDAFLNDTMAKLKEGRETRKYSTKESLMGPTDPPQSTTI